MLFWELAYKELYEKEIPLCVNILEKEKRKRVAALISPLGAVYPVKARCLWGVVVCSVQFQAVTDGNFVRNHWAAANSTVEIQQATAGVCMCGAESCLWGPATSFMLSLSHSDSHALDKILFARI